MSAQISQRHNTGKPQLSFNLLGREVQNGEAAVWEFGAKKYAPGNWLKGMSWTSGADSLLRHLAALMAGEDNDPETGLPHVDHIVCCAKILSNSFHTRKDLDDRPAQHQQKAERKYNEMLDEAGRGRPAARDLEPDFGGPVFHAMDRDHAP